MKVYDGTVDYTLLKVSHLITIPTIFILREEIYPYSITFT